ncbi:hypothetical protein [Arundinibacter roseus]|uniref:Uncharacterized protein n=1 Tax=Arundinibacter roseus TaxID=2070510 RepID=A0A4R4KK51_9BACT|nr:hypothetical protein [Arundinibacter roseus]TDB67049.1 hypothetical protein EZE20_08020 [Arundinibacter roseus]
MANKSNNLPEKFIIRFQTAAYLPSPYAHEYSLSFDTAHGSLAVDFVLNYLDRDELDLETILDEGFTENDDYAWKGTLPFVWKTRLQQMVQPKQLVLNSYISENDSLIEIEFQDEEEQQKIQFPADTELWDYFLQEIIQAIYEASGKERPFELRYLHIEKMESSLLNFQASFLHCTFQATLDQHPTVLLPWESVNELMATVFTAEFIPEEAYQRKPTQPGNYLYIGDDLWYAFGEGIVEPAPKSKILPKMQQLFDRLHQEILTKIGTI